MRNYKFVGGKVTNVGRDDFWEITSENSDNAAVFTAEEMLVGYGIEIDDPAGKVISAALDKLTDSEYLKLKGTNYGFPENSEYCFIVPRSLVSDFDIVDFWE